MRSSCIFGCVHIISKCFQVVNEEQMTKISVPLSWFTKLVPGKIVQQVREAVYAQLEQYQRKTASLQKAIQVFDCFGFDISSRVVQ